MINGLTLILDTQWTHFGQYIFNENNLLFKSDRDKKLNDRSMACTHFEKYDTHFGQYLIKVVVGAF